MKMSNKTYDILKFISVIAVDAGIFIATITDVIGLHKYGVIIAAIISACGVFCGAIIEKSSKLYKAEQERLEEEKAEEE